MNQPNNLIRVGVIGVGAMGRNHVRVATACPSMHCVGVFDAHDTAAKQVANQYNCSSFRTVEELIESVDAVIVASPTVTHFELGKKILGAGRHCLMEKPITVSVEEGVELDKLAQSKSLILSVGHIERHNPVYSELQKIVEDQEILAINFRRLSYNLSRANDVDVILDLMIHDLDTANVLLPGDLMVAGAIGAAYRSPTLDYVSAHLMSDCGVSATLSASKISQVKTRSLEVSCADCFVSVDYLRKDILINRHSVGRYTSDARDVGYRQESLVEQVFVPNVEPLMAEHLDFSKSILEAKAPLVTAQDGIGALRLATEIQRKCKL